MYDKGCLTNLNNYGPYADFIETGDLTIRTDEINISNWSDHFNGLLNIFKDGIETDLVKYSFVKVIFPEGEIELSLPDYFLNIIMWHLIVRVNKPIRSKHIFFEPAITKQGIKNYIDDNFIDENRTTLSNIEINNIIDDAITNFRNLNDFALYFANTINLKDTIDLMNKSPEFYQTLCGDYSAVSLENIKSVTNDVANQQVDLILNSKKILGYEHCMAPALRTHEAINPKQLREYMTAIGAKPDGMGSILNHTIQNSFISGGLASIEDYFVDSYSGRIAQILKKGNLGDSGSFARTLGLNNTDTTLNKDPHYDCMSQNYEEIVIKNSNILRMYRGRYYKLQPHGNLLNIKITDTHLIGQKIYVRSPMTCASNSKGDGICYKCYGDLAYTNVDINIGKIAAENLSSVLTQILLSAKHLLEVNAKQITWVPEFNEYFNIESNIIKLNPENIHKNYFILINPDDIQADNEDYISDTDETFGSYVEYITKFYILTPAQEMIEIHDTEYGKMFIESDLNDKIRHKSKPYKGFISVPLTALDDINLFSLIMTNNELSSVMNRLIAILNKRDVTLSYDRNTILQAFIDTITEGGLSISAVHCEVLLSNQIRDPEDILEKPDWSYPNANYQLFTLNSALTDHPSVVVSLLYEKLGRTLNVPLTYKKHKSSVFDAYFQIKPQEYINNNDNIVSKKDIGKIANDTEKLEMPFIFNDED